MHVHENLIRKQFLVSRSQVTKIEALANAKGTSAAEIVRLAIDAFEPESANAVNTDDLMELVSAQLKEAIASTRQANKKVAQTLKSIAMDH